MHVYVSVKHYQIALLLALELLNTSWCHNFVTSDCGNVILKYFIVIKTCRVWKEGQITTRSKLYSIS
jgi:hypothetical protein